MNFISSIFSTYFSITNFSIITKIIVLFAIVLYIYSLIKLLNFKFIELIYSFIGCIAGLLGIVIVGFIYKIIYHILVFIIFGAELQAFYTIPFDEIGCVILTVTFLGLSYCTLEVLLDDDKTPRVPQNQRYNSNPYINGTSGGGLYDEYRGNFEIISYDEYLKFRQTHSYDRLKELEKNRRLNHIVELNREEQAREEQEKLENQVTVTREWDYHKADYVEKTHYKC